MVSAHGISWLIIVQDLSWRTPGFYPRGTVQCWGEAWRCLCAAPEQGGQGSGCTLLTVLASAESIRGTDHRLFCGGKKVAGSNSLGCTYS